MRPGSRRSLAAAPEVDNLQAQDVVNLRGNYANMV